MSQTPEIPLQDQQQELPGEPEEMSPANPERIIVEIAGTHVRYEGDPEGLWHIIVIGGEPVPDIYIGPGPSPGPHVIG